MKKKVTKALKKALVRLKDRKILLATVGNIGLLLVTLGVIDASALKELENYAIIIVTLLVNLGVLHKPEHDVEDEDLTEEV